VIQRRQLRRRREALVRQRWARFDSETASEKRPVASFGGQPFLAPAPRLAAGASQAEGNDDPQSKDPAAKGGSSKLGWAEGVFVPVLLNIWCDRRAAAPARAHPPA